MHPHSFLGLQWNRSPDVDGQMEENQFEDLREDPPKKVEIQNRAR